MLSTREMQEKHLLHSNSLEDCFINAAIALQPPRRLGSFYFLPGYLPRLGQYLPHIFEADSISSVLLQLSG